MRFLLIAAVAALCSCDQARRNPETTGSYERLRAPRWGRSYVLYPASSHEVNRFCIRNGDWRVVSFDGERAVFERIGPAPLGEKWESAR